MNKRSKKITSFKTNDKSYCDNNNNISSAENIE